MIAASGPANHLHAIDRLGNAYSAMRHGQSRANVAGIIVSRIESDRRGDYGLSELGRQQAREAARASRLPADTIICSSDFARASQTAEIVRAYLGAPEVELAAALRERCFGELEGSATENYARVWAADEAGSAPAAGGVESVDAVLDRTTAFIVELERRYAGRHILLVAHGDTLQILQAGFRQISPARHRSLPGLSTGEIRRLLLREPDSGKSGEQQGLRQHWAGLPGAGRPARVSSNGLDGRCDRASGRCAMDGLAFSPEALEANHRGHLSPTQKRALQAYVDSLPRAFTSRLLFGQGTHDKELQAGRVLLFEGVTVRKEWEPEDKEFQIEAASRQDGFKTFWSLEDLYNFAPEKGLVRVYYLPKTSWAVNLQRLSGRPLTRQDLEPGLLRQRALEAGDRRRTPDPVERAYLAADVEAAQRTFRSYLPGGAPLPALSGRAADPRLLAASLIGPWWNPGLTIDLRADGTVTVVGPWVAVLASALADPGNGSAARARGGSRGRSRADVQSGPTTASGTWSVGADGRLQTGALGTPLVADAVVAGNELTLVIDGNPWRFERLL